MLNLDIESLSKYVERPHAMHLDLDKGKVMGIEGSKRTNKKIHLAHVEAFKFLKQDYEKWPSISSSSLLPLNSFNPLIDIWQKALRTEYEELDAWALGGGKGENRQEATQRIKNAYELHSTELDLSYLGLNTLPEFIGCLPFLKGLALSENFLKHLPESIGQLTELNVLVLYDNYLVALPESIGYLKSLRTLIVTNNCLEVLPESMVALSDLTHLNLSENHLTSLPEFIGHLSALKNLQLIRNRLTLLPESLPHLTQLTELYLAENTFMGLPKSLKKLKRERGETIYVDLAQVPENIVVCHEAMIHNPLPFLVETAFYGFSKKISFEHQIGIDVGGLSKQYVQDLCCALKETGALKIENNLPSPKSDLDLEVYQDFGEFLKRLNEKNKGRSDPIFIGRLFDDVFFDLLKILLEEESEMRKKTAVSKLLANPFQHPLVVFLEIPSPTIDQIAAIRSYFLAQSIPLDSSDPDLIKQECFSFFEPSYKAGLSLLQGLDQSFKTFIKETSAENISLSLQGQAIHKARLIEAIKVRPDEDHPIVLEKKGWIQEKILHESTDLIWCEKFLYAITAQRVIGPTVIIHITANPVDFRCLAHTCFNQLEVSICDEIEMGEPADVIASTDSLLVKTNKRQKMFFRTLELLMNETKVHGL